MLASRLSIFSLLFYCFYNLHAIKCTGHAFNLIIFNKYSQLCSHHSKQDMTFLSPENFLLFFCSQRLSPTICISLSPSLLPCPSLLPSLFPFLFVSIYLYLCILLCIYPPACDLPFYSLSGIFEEPEFLYAVF